MIPRGSQVCYILYIFLLILRGSAGWYVEGNAEQYDAQAIIHAKPDKLGSYHRPLGEILDGDVRQDSVYEAAYPTPAKKLPCYKACTKTYQEGDIALFKKFIEVDYRAQMLLDSLPISEEKISPEDQKTVFELGYPVGLYVKPEEGIPGGTFLYNHIDFVVGLHEEEGKTGYQVVGFEARPASIPYNNVSDFYQVCTDHPVNADKSTFLNLDKITTFPVDITWTYSVEYQVLTPDIKWSQRWTRLMSDKTSPELHWVSVSYSIVVAIGMAGLIAIILLRILRTQNAVGRAYGQLDDTSYTEDTGWKALHGDVFRPPPQFMTFSIVIGSGAQVLATATLVILLSALGILSPAISGSRTTALVTIFVLMGIIAGFVSARVYIMMKGARKRRNAVLTAFGFSGVVYIIWFITDIAMWSTRFNGQSSTGAPSFGIMCALFAMWFFIMTPLVFLGSFLAHRRYGTLEKSNIFPTHTNQIPRMIPAIVWYMHPLALMLVLGVLPFGTVFSELFFLLSAMWSHHIYYLFGVVLLVFILLVVITAEVAVVLCYFQLSNEDYHWWWRSLMFPGVTVSYILVYSLFYFGVNLHLAWGASVIVFMGYTLIMGLVLFVLMGFVSFFACLLFVLKIYSTLHVE